MNKRIVYIMFVIMLISCATAGKINSNRFTDNAYPFEIQFPKNYDVSAQPSKSIQRVIAIIGSDKLTTYIKPMFVVSISSTEKSLNELIDKEKNSHFEPRYYMNTVIENEEYSNFGGQEGYIVYYTGMAVKAATAMVKFGEYFIKIEYIAATELYNEDDLNGVLKGITFIK